jgi:hypothetical protein
MARLGGAVDGIFGNRFDDCAGIYRVIAGSAKNAVCGSFH